LPIAKPSKINVNTLLPEQAPLLAMLMPDTLTVEGARQALLQRQPQGYADAAAFWKAAGIAPSSDAATNTAVTTTWFALRVDVTVGSAELEQHGLIDASTLPARLASRQWGEPS
jgi:general secretion pathway protein K